MDEAFDSCVNPFTPDSQRETAHVARVAAATSFQARPVRRERRNELVEHGCAYFSGPGGKVSPPTWNPVIQERS